VINGYSDDHQNCTYRASDLKKWENDEKRHVLIRMRKPVIQRLQKLKPRMPVVFLLAQSHGVGCSVPLHTD
jgi:hypothetical protein